ncbi:MAG: YdcF family protein [Magnetococcus sp. THC-1_WYH]
MTSTVPRNFVIVSSIDWTCNWQIHQHLATSLVDAGHRVLFIENTGVRAPQATASDLDRILQRIRNWFKSTGGFSDVRDSLTLFSPLLLPFPYSWPAIQLNRYLISITIRKWSLINQFHNPVVITFLPTPLAQGVINTLDGAAVIYYCANDMAGGSTGAKRLEPFEDTFFSKADAVFCISHTLQDRAARFNPKVFLIPGGVDVAKFEAARNSLQTPSELTDIPSPRVGYVGTVGGVFDQEMVCLAAQALPNVSFVLVGPESVDTTALRAQSNIHLLGPKPHNQIPWFIDAFDVTVIPYIRNAFTDSVYSCKLNEYLAVGKPVVTTNLREVRLYAEQYPGVIDVVPGTPEFIAAIQATLEGEQDPDAPNHRVVAARQNSWEQRFHDIMKAVEEVVALKQAQQPRWQDQLLLALRRSRIKALKALTAVAAIYLLLFHTPIVWWAGQQLIVSQPPIRSAEAIVVFSGYGEPAYVNTDYQKRALDALELFQTGYGRVIVLSSGKHFAMSETEVIRALLINKGVPDSAIVSTLGDPGSTFENINVAATTLRQMGIKDVLLVTAPYHTRRASWVWQKQVSDIGFVMAHPHTELKVIPDREVSWKKIYSIAFEYIAIVYYKFKGWL